VTISSRYNAVVRKRWHRTTPIEFCFIEKDERRKEGEEGKTTLKLGTMRKESVEICMQNGEVVGSKGRLKPGFTQAPALRQCI